MVRAISVRTGKTLSKQQTCDALKWLGIVVGWVMVCFLLTCILYVATPYSADQTQELKNDGKKENDQTVSIHSHCTIN